MAQEASAGRPIFTNGKIRGVDLSVSGGSGILRYYVSGGYDREEGVLPSSAFRRLSGRVNLTLSPTNEFTVDANLGVIRAHRDLSMNRGNSVMFALQFGNPLLQDSPTRGFLLGPPELWSSAYETFQDVDRYIAGLNITHRPFPWLTHRLTVGRDFTAEDNQAIVELQPDSLRQFLSTPEVNGQKIVNRRNRSVTTVDYGATATLPVTGAIESKTSVGLQYFRNFTESQYSEGHGFPAPGLSTIAAAAQTFGGDDFIENVTFGVYLQQQFSLDDRLFITAGLRGDDNSAFGSNYDFVTYPKLSGSWVVSEEPFWDLEIVNTLRLRAAYGHAGQQPNAFAALRTYQPTTAQGGATAITPDAIGNPDLGPERSEEVEVGFEIGILQNRLNLDFTYYNQRTSDMILLRPVAPSSGFSSQRFINAGLITNEGIELGVSTTPVNTANVRWDVAFSISSNDNEIVNLNPAEPDLTSIGSFQRQAEGYPVGSFFGRRIVRAEFNPSTGMAENVMCDGGDESATPVPCADAPDVFLGRPTPEYQGALSSTLNLFDRFTLHAQFDFKSGFVHWDVTNLGRCWIFRVCRINVRPGEFDPIRVAAVQGSASLAYAYFLSDASFIKLRGISLRYAVPNTWAQSLGADRASISLAARNLYTWTEYSGLDPESVDISSAGGLAVYDQTSLPPLANLTATIRLTW